MSDLTAWIPGALESFGAALVHRMGLVNLWTAALLVGALVLDRALAQCTRASLRIALYAPVALRVLLPLDWTAGLPHARVATVLAPLATIGATSGTTAPGSRASSWYAVVAVGYAVAAAFLAARAILARVRLARELASARVVSGLDADLPCRIVEHDDLGPMAAGLLAPCVVVPRRLLVAGQERTLAWVLRHEAAHLRRRDAWLLALMQLLSIVAWPVVPLWIAIARVRQLLELACDEAAVAGADDAERRRYGRALLDVAEWQSFAVAPLGAGELRFGSTLRARIEALASHRHWPVGSQALALALAPVAMLAACGSAATAAGTSTSADGDAADYGYEFEHDSASRATSPVSTAAASTPSDAPAPGRLPPEAIQAVVRSHFAMFQGCYEAGLKKDPTLRGTVSVEYVIGEDGTTRETNGDASTLRDKDVVGCIATEFHKLTYPKPHGGIVTVVYPIELAP